MEEVAPFIPQGKDVDAMYFPKANMIDEDLREIIDDQMKCQSYKVDKDFNDFEGVNY